MGQGFPDVLGQQGDLNLLKALISWSLRKAPLQSNTLFTGNLLSFLFLHIVFISFCFSPSISYLMFFFIFQVRPS